MRRRPDLLDYAEACAQVGIMLAVMAMAFIGLAMKAGWW